jgi:hypothetical protein
MLTRRQYKTFFENPSFPDEDEFIDDMQSQNPKNASRIDKSLKKPRKLNKIARKVTDIERLISFSENEEEKTSI